MALPTAEQEIWRYSRIGELDLDRFRPAAADHHRAGRRRVRRPTVTTLDTSTPSTTSSPS